MKELKQKEKEILEHLEKRKEGDFMTKIAFAIKCNSYYTIDYLRNLRKLKLIERVEFGRFYYWRLPKADDKN